MSKIKLGISMGDPAGVGPEVTCKACAALSAEYDLVIYGHPQVLERQAQQLNLPTPFCIPISETTDLPELGKVSKEAGALSLAAVEAAIADCQNQSIAGFVTAPINKEAIQLAGCPFPGHTELLADRCGAKNIGMLLTDGSLSVALVTIHCSLTDAIQQISVRENNNDYSFTR